MKKRESSKVEASVFSLQLCPGYRQPMSVVESAEAVEQTGLRNDRHANHGSLRQVLLVEKETLDVLNLPPGTIKENVTTVGISLMGLGAASRLRIGPDVVLEIVKQCSPCSRMDEIRPGLQRELAGRRGMLARVIKGGVIRRGDPISVTERRY
jgi:MOSC domain-containing protein YiiM